jgi:hypothetical protein
MSGYLFAARADLTSLESLQQTPAPSGVRPLVVTICGPSPPAQARRRMWSMGSMAMEIGVSARKMANMVSATVLETPFRRTETADRRVICQSPVTL